MMTKRQMMPVYKCPNGMYRVGSGACVYKTKKAAAKALKAVKAKQKKKGK